MNKYGIWLEDDGVTLQFSKKNNLSQFHFVYHKSHMDRARCLWYTKHSCATSPIVIILLACSSIAVDISSSNRYLPLVKECRSNTRCRQQGYYYCEPFSNPIICEINLAQVRGIVSRCLHRHKNRHRMNKQIPRTTLTSHIKLLTCSGYKD